MKEFPALVFGDTLILKDEARGALLLNLKNQLGLILLLARIPVRD